MKKLIVTLAVAFPALLLTSCSSCPWCSTGGGGDASAELVLCDDCGVEKGADECCDAEAARCADCDKIKGSAGCCA